MKKLWTVLMSALLPLLSLCGGEPRIFIEPHAPVAGEVFMIVVELDSTETPQFVMPSIPGVRLSSRITSTRSDVRIINGKREASVSYGFRALAERPGKYTLPPLKITVGKEDMESAPITFTVRDPAKLAGPDELNPDRVQLRMRIEPARQLYIGETAKLIWELIVPQHVQLSGIRDIRESGLGDAVFVLQGRERSKFVQTSRRRTAKNGVGYHILEFTGYFQPQLAGNFTPQGTVSLQIAVADRHSFFPVTREVTVRSAAAQFTVLPLPPLPANTADSGLTGDWQIRFAPVPAGGFKSGEVAELTLNVSGSVKTELFHAPELKLTQARVYPPEVKRTPDGFTVKYLFVPLAPGTYKTVLDLAVFDPDKREFRIEKCPVEYTVAPGVVTPSVPAVPAEKKPVAVPVRELPLYPREAGTPVLLPLAENTRAWSILLTVAGVVLAIAGWYRQHHRKCTSAGDREMRRKLRDLAHELEKTDSAAGVLREHGLADVASALGLPPGATAAEIAAALDDAELQKFFRALDDDSFRPGAVRTAESAALREKLAAMLKKLMLFGGILFLLPLMADIEAGRQAFDRGDYAKARTHFQNALDPDAPDPYNYFNLGCSEYMAGDYPDAALSLEQAYLLLPGDAGIKAAWDDCRSHLPGHSESTDRSFTEYIRSQRDTVRPDTYILIAAMGIFVLGAMVFAGSFPYRKILMAAVMIVVIAAAAAVWSQSCSTYSPDRARITAVQAEVHRLPAAGGSVAGIIPGGAEVWITGTRDNWVQVRYHGQLTGWIEKNTVKRIMPHGIW